MDPLTYAFAQSTPGADGTTLLVGIAAIITAVGTLLGVLRFYLRQGKDDDDGTELAADARDRIRLLKETIADLERSLDQCRSARSLSEADSRLKDRHIGMLEGTLATTRKQLADAERRLEECERER